MNNVEGVEPQSPVWIFKFFSYFMCILRIDLRCIMSNKA